MEANEIKQNFPQDFHDLPDNDLIGYFFGSRQGDLKNFRISAKKVADSLGIVSLGGAPIYFEGNQLPSLNNTDEPVKKGDWVNLSASQTYLNVNGGDDIETPSDRWSIGSFDGSTWSLKDMGKLPQTDVEKSKLNKGFDYPFVNQPTPKSSSLIKANNVILDVIVEETSHSSRYEYSVTLLGRNVSTNNWGNVISFRQLDRENSLNQSASRTFSSNDPSITSQELIQLNKINEGGLQLLNFTIPGFVNRTIKVLIDTDAILDNELLDIGYSGSDNKMYFSGSCYSIFPAIPSIANLATKTELTNAVAPLSDWIGKADKFNVNYDKDFPFINYPSSPTLSAKVSIIKKSVLEAKVTSTLYKEWDFYLGGFYKGHSGYGNGFIVMRRRKSDGIVGGMFLTTLGSGLPNLDAEGLTSLNSWSSGGRQYTIINPTNLPFGITKIELALNIDEIPAGYTQLGYQDNANWNLINFHRSVYLDPIVIPPAIEQIKSFNTFKEALVANQTGLVKVGGILSESKVNPVTFSGNGSAYFPSQISDQYRVVNNRNMQPKISREIMSIELEYSTPTPPVIKGYGEKYIYFGTPAYLYRTQFGLNNRVNTYLNTKFERIKLPSIIPDSQYSENPIFNVFELGNGEILIELRNGVKENPEDDYRGHRMQLYLTDGFPELIPVENSNGVLEYDLTGIITKVTEYKAKTSTVYRTTYSIHGSKIAISPYGLGLTGMVHLSNDYGKTWKVIFNMGVMGSEFAVPYKGSQGAWPLPENLTPPMPSDMWTVGGNSNFHTHGVIIDPYRDNRIWVCTGDAGENANGRSAIFFTDNDGVDWTRITEKGAGLFDDYFGMQAMGFVVTENMILFGTDSGNDGFKRAIFKDKNSTINIEAAYWCNGTYRTALDRIFGGSVEVSNGGIYSVFFPNTPTSYKKGLVVYTPDGIDFKNIYYDEVNDESGTGDINIYWGSFMFKDRFDNVYLSNPNGSIIKFY